MHTAPPRTRSARLTLVSLLLIPLLSLGALWAFIASVTLGNVIKDQNNNTFTTKLATPTIILEQTLGAERALTLVWLGSDRKSPQVRAQLVAARQRTDAAAATEGQLLPEVRGLVSAAAQPRVDSFLAELGELPTIRRSVDSNGTVVTASTAYGAFSNALYEFLANSSPSSDPDLAVEGEAAVTGNRAEDLAADAIALAEGLVAAQGRTTAPERALFAQIVGQQDLEQADAIALADPALKSLLNAVFDSSAYQHLVAVENQIDDSSGSLPPTVNTGTLQATGAGIQLAELPTLPKIARLLALRSAALHDSLLTELYLAGGLGLAAVLVSVTVAVVFGRRLREDLTGLYESARQMAEERLPLLVERLRRGEDVDALAESPPLRTGRITEIANVAQAFSSVQRTAVAAAVGQAGLRKGVNQVFVSLSLRNQSLLHRQLALLDEMERATSDPVALADLFSLDHLTTRMRRHAEGLLILAGATPGRGWRDPVPVADALNAAVAEIEEYVRVDVQVDAADAVAGIAVNDVIHLMAELIENATSFSPPTSRVEIRGAVVGHGFAVEIEDRGLGIMDEELAAINARLAHPPEFDLANTDQLGLFVAGRLAARHGIRVSLRQSPFGGTTAIVLLPRTIVVSELLQGGDASQPPMEPGSRAETASAGRERIPGFGLTGRHRLSTAPPVPRARPILPTPGPDRSTALAPSRSPATPPGRPGPVAPGTHQGMPTRVRGQNLNPHLRSLSRAAGADSPIESSGPQARSPEEAGSLFSALQSGLQRGRNDALGDLHDQAPDAWATEARPNDYEV
jgi:signal transduction histidine kinase